VEQQQVDEEVEIMDEPTDDASDPDFIDEAEAEEEKPKMNLQLSYQGN
jgi:hypothetical protein